jgi:hypothetical protein
MGCQVLQFSRKTVALPHGSTGHARDKCSEHGIRFVAMRLKKLNREELVF